MAAEEWQWPFAPSDAKHNERVALLRPISYQASVPLEDEPRFDRSGKALSLNISSGGILLLMDWAPPVEQVLKVNVPTPLTAAETPTLAEVRWVRKVPFGVDDSLCFVGLKFLF